MNEFSPSLPLNPRSTTQAGNPAGSDSTGALTSLTSRMARQDETAFTEFLSLYQDRLFRYTIVLVRGDEHLAQEALQQTMIKVVKHIRRFDDEDIFWSWLTRIVRSVTIDDSRKRTRYQSFLSRWFGQRNIETDLHKPGANDHQLLQRLESVLPDLPAEDADLLRRKYQERETVRQIAVALGSTEKAVESRLVRIRRQLRDIILKQEATDE